MELTHNTGLRQLPVVNPDRRLAGFLDQSDVPGLSGASQELRGPDDQLRPRDPAAVKRR